MIVGIVRRRPLPARGREPAAAGRGDGAAAPRSARWSPSAAGCARRRGSCSDRLTPGGLGLEFTTLVAVLAVGLYVVIAYAVVDRPATRGRRPGTATALDFVGRPAAPLAHRHRQGGDRARLGRGHPAADRARRGGAARRAAALGRGRRCWSSRRLIIYVGVAELKDGDRPAAAAGPADRASAARRFPSGHAAHSMIYPWLALTARRSGCARGWPAARPLLVAGRGAGGGRRAVARLPRRPLPERRQRRAGRWASRPSRSARPSRWSSPTCARIRARWRRLAKIGTEYFLFGGAGAGQPARLRALILVPALGSYGRGWEKATAAFLSALRARRAGR